MFCLTTLLNYLFLASRRIQRRLVMPSASGLGNCAASPRLGCSDLRVAPARLPGSLPATSAVPLSVRVAVVRQFLDVVHRAIQFPLSVDLLLASEREAVHPLVVSDVAEHWGDRCKPASDHLAALVGVGLALHPLGGRLLALGVRSYEDGHLFELATMRMA